MGRVSTPGFPDCPEDANHEVLAFVLPQSDVHFPALGSLLRESALANGAKYAESSWPGVIDQAAAYADNWIVLVTFQEDDLVHGDLRDMASRYYAEHPRAAEMATCRARIDIYVADTAVHQAAFDCLDTAIKWLKAHPAVICIDPETGEPALT